MNKVYYANLKGTGKTVLVTRHHAVEVNWLNAIKVQVIDNVLLNTISTEVLFQKRFKI
jgi:hypothetical protein